MSNGTPSGSSPLLNHAALSTVTHKKLMCYMSFTNLPNQVRRKSVRKGLLQRSVFSFHFFLQLTLLYRKKAQCEAWWLIYFDDNRCALFLFIYCHVCTREVGSRPSIPFELRVWLGSSTT